MDDVVNTTNAYRMFLFSGIIDTNDRFELNDNTIWKQIFTQQHRRTGDASKL